MIPVSSVLQVRAAEKRDWPWIRELCCRTADSRGPIEKSRWDFFAEIWIGPYQRLIPNWTLVAELSGRPAGYLTGCADTKHFMRLRRVLFRLPLFFRVLAGEYPKNADTLRFLRRALRVEKTPERRFPRRVRKLLGAKYPAHLHMNVEAEFRKEGVGKLLFEKFRQELARERVSGIHLFCGEGPLEFYRRLGFKEIGCAKISKGVRVFALGYEI